MLELKAKCDAKKAAQAALIPNEWRIKVPKSLKNVLDIPRRAGILSKKELLITELDDVDIALAKLATGEWSSYEVTLAYCKRAAIAHQLTNCLTEILFDDALAQARELDEYLALHGRPKGPLHGIPISLKDQFPIDGVEITMGYACWLGRISDSNAVLVDVLREAGAVFHCRTNVPQTLMWAETYNHVFGLTVNPYNRALTSGGSSGGEGALIALRGSILGVGTDIGGSVRIPAACNGLYGFRPSTGRIPYQGAMNSMVGQETVESVIGPLARSLSTIKKFYQVVLNAECWRRDPKILDLPFRQDHYELTANGGHDAKYSFAIIKTEGYVLPDPPILRALSIVADALREQGHEILDWDASDHREGVELINEIFQADGGADFIEQVGVSGETHILSERSGAALSTLEVWKLNHRKETYRKQYLDKWEKAISPMTGRVVDAIISPVAPHTAPKHGQYIYCGHTSIWNLLDYPSCAFPVTKVQASLDAPDPAFKPLSGLDAQCNAQYDVRETAGSPVALQLTGRRHKDEHLLGMMQVLLDSLAHSDQYDPQTL
ncbi:uncharacterized protein L969DRAFT_96833 [Mixia osmundae IAM 14324]|uniref:amidase n=1 Tax=Mixia osmundae (strain CBS 9802 / IAM 14324 / JCM 22182 / KY 12970) TaxID=764103 RepID=G7E281_MIXOS|nr:uncharacterized protein L969DRAFT_96833 [Mixia osmundae IAM 14324]KEI36813.1 hypothetical protein L969DRAFT_96833 [Mixia osmundae IAM 14324]GAA96941.1 hypothetical protein E5Q_03615 [Mixia osmundae IAM 14324]